MSESFASINHRHSFVHESLQPYKRKIQASECSDDESIEETNEHDHIDQHSGRHPSYMDAAPFTKRKREDHSLVESATSSASKQLENP